MRVLEENCKYVDIEKVSNYLIELEKLPDLTKLACLKINLEESMSKTKGQNMEIVCETCLGPIFHILNLIIMKMNNEDNNGFSLKNQVTSLLLKTRILKQKEPSEYDRAIRKFSAKLATMK